MTELRYINIEGYKGLKSIELDFKSINIITGRNNTGKTSLLEAIDLVFNPSNLGQYQDHLDGLINVEAKYDNFTIDAHFNNHSRKIGVGPSEPDIAVQIYAKIVSGILSPDQAFYFRPLLEIIEEGQEEELYAVLSDAIEEIILSLSKDSIELIANNIYSVSYNGEQTTFAYLGRYHANLARNIIDNHFDEILTQVKEQQIDIKSDVSEKLLNENLKRAIDRAFTFTQGTSFFIESPQDYLGVTFIRSPKLDEEPDVEDEDMSAVLKTEIRDYLNDHGLIEGLQDFDFDKLVKESDDGTRQTIDYEFMGDGFKVTVGILWELMARPESNDIVLIEEPENHMHPGYIDELIPFLIRVAIEDDIQLFITTHNLDFLAGFFDDDIVEPYQDYIEENMKFIQLTDKLTKELDYQEAEYELEELHTDLRGT